MRLFIFLQNQIQNTFKQVVIISLEENYRKIHSPPHCVSLDYFQ